MLAFKEMSLGVRIFLTGDRCDLYNGRMATCFMSSERSPINDRMVRMP